MNLPVFYILGEDPSYEDVSGSMSQMWSGTTITFAVTPDFYNTMPIEVREFLIKNRRGSLNLPFYATSNVEFWLSDVDFNLFNETMAHELGHS